MPPGWYDVPEASPPPDGLAGISEEVPTAPRQAAGPPDIPKPAIEAVIEEAVQAILGGEYISLTNGAAVFMGHTLTLSGDGLEAIRTVLKLEICYSLEREKERILGTVLDTRVPEPDRGDPDVPQVSGSAAEMVSKAEGGPEEVPRVRVEATPSNAEDVREVPRKQTRKKRGGSRA
jgi:hypothetical protein